MITVYINLKFIINIKNNMGKGHAFKKGARFKIRMVYYHGC